MTLCRWCHAALSRLPARWHCPHCDRPCFVDGCKPCERMHGKH